MEGKEIKIGYYFGDVGMGNMSSIIQISGKAPFLRVKEINLIRDTFTTLDSLNDVKLGERIPEFDHLMGIGA